MTTPFNADEIYEMAEQIERNGARFYRRAARGAVDPRNRRLLLDFAAMEEEHEKIFASMRADLAREKPETAAFDPDGQAALYLRAMAGGHVFDGEADPTQLFTGKETVEDIFRVAMGMEKDSIVFYLGMKELVPERLGKNRIDGIIHEEMGHLAILGKELATLTQELC
ncbi:MAG: rubrerythrin [Thermodesulfobacteriota bacterium]